MLLKLDCMLLKLGCMLSLLLHACTRGWYQCFCYVLIRLEHVNKQVSKARDSAETECYTLLAQLNQHKIAVSAQLEQLARRTQRMKNTVV